MDMPSTTFAEIQSTARANKLYSLNVFSGTNLGRNTFTVRMSIADFVEMSVVANKSTLSADEYKDEFEAQRPFYPAHAKGLALYTLKGLVMSNVFSRKQNGKSIDAEVQRIVDDLAGGPYAALQPLVCNIRKTAFGGGEIPFDYAASKDLPFFKATLTPMQKLWVVDGQHRRGGFDYVIKYLSQLVKSQTYPAAKGSLYNPHTTGSDGKIGATELEFWEEVNDLALNECSLTVEIHLGLGAKEERQLFADLNYRAKKLSVSLLTKYDESDAIAVMVAQRLVGNDEDDDAIIKFNIHDETDAKAWDSDGMTMSDVLMVCRLLVHGNNSKKPTPPSVVDMKFEYIKKFFKVVQTIEGFGGRKQRSLTVAGQPVVLKALAKLAYDHAYGTAKLKDEEGLKLLYEAIQTGNLSFSHQEPLWRALFMNDEARNEKYSGINDFVYLGDQFKGGEYDEENNWVRYGPAHNDIYPRLGDIIRWRLGLKNRGAAEKARLRAESQAIAAKINFAS